MHTRPLIIKERTLEIGYKGHTRWGVLGGRGTTVPTVLGDFHLFITFKAKRDERPFIHRNQPIGPLMLAHDTFYRVTVNDRCILELYNLTDEDCRRRSILSTCVPYPPDMFFTDFAEWRISYENCFPIPEYLHKDALRVALAYLKYKQAVLDAHIEYWDIEGRPPLSQLSIEEVLAKYDTSCRGTEQVR